MCEAQAGTAVEKTIRDSIRPVSEFEIMRKEKFLIHAPGTAHVSVWRSRIRKHKRAQSGTTEDRRRHRLRKGIAARCRAAIPPPCLPGLSQIGGRPHTRTASRTPALENA
jgi:hypothetical protein